MLSTFSVLSTSSFRPHPGSRPHSQCQLFCYSSLLYISSVRTRPPRISRHLVIGYLRLSECVELSVSSPSFRCPQFPALYNDALHPFVWSLSLKLPRPRLILA